MFIEREGLSPFENKVWLASPTMHGDELKYMTEAYMSNWMSTVGQNITSVEETAAGLSGTKYAVGLSNGTAALHLAIKLAGEKLYGRAETGCGTLEGKRVFCSDMTFDATVNPVVYEGGVPVFIDTDPETWNMDPLALEKAFELYPDVRLVVYAELYGFPGGVDRIQAICEKNGAVLVEDAAEALGASVNGKPCGSFGDYGIISYNGNKIITGSAGGCLLTDAIEEAKKAKKWSTQSRENAPWYQHEELGYNYRMSNVIAGVIRGQYPYLNAHIEQKKAIYERYKEGFKDLPVKMSSMIDGIAPNYWLSAMIIDEEAMCHQVRTACEAVFVGEAGKTCPTEVLDVLATYNAEGRPIWKPMHMQPIYSKNEVIGRAGRLGCGAAMLTSNTDITVGFDIFTRGVCLPSDNKMSGAGQDCIIELISRCFE